MAPSVGTQSSRREFSWRFQAIPQTSKMPSKHPANTQALQVVTGMPPTSTSGGSTPAASAPRIPPPGVVGPVADPPRRSTSSDTSPKDDYLSSRTGRPPTRAGDIPLRK
ncbi:UNVERIFIED_CONTAM: hypothetical protein Slati_2476900 [Sesamum latifolium]|uniref:Uncharacterized protein n=1 Tax=Sesamum latifolium TaxID=2727402 RepID=A0AAW2WDZ7_9LAMI